VSLPALRRLLENEPSSAWKVYPDGIGHEGCDSACLFLPQSYPWEDRAALIVALRNTAELWLDLYDAAFGGTGTDIERALENLSRALGETGTTAEVTPRQQRSLLANRAKAERVISGALASAIDAHGPITRENRASAAKRVYKTLCATAKGNG
jgi:hypothetical protein